jgi:hypothetical protein
MDGMNMCIIQHGVDSKKKKTFFSAQLTFKTHKLECFSFASRYSRAWNLTYNCSTRLWTLLNNTRLA